VYIRGGLQSLDVDLDTRRYIGDLSKNFRQRGILSPPARRGRACWRREISGRLTGNSWWGGRGSNPRPTDYESAALTN
jgi:hypothetical protein